VNTPHTAGWIGATIERLEDDRLLTGTEPFVADVRLPGQLAAAIVRSPVAHGILRAIRVEAAQAHPGVIDVFTADDIVGDLGSVPVIRPRLSPDASLEPYLQPVLARERVRFVGEPVAVIVADTRHAAEDAAELVILDIEPIQPVLDTDAADDAPPLFDGFPNHIDVRSSYGDADAALERADVVVTARLAVGRHTGIPMETRGLVADWDAPRRQLTVHGTTKVLHHKRRELAAHLGLAEENVRMLALAAGGGFGIKGEEYPEDFLIPWAAKRIGRPISWIEDRREHLLAANHSRQQLHDASIGATADGRILALVTRFRLDAGAYVRTVGVRVAELTMGAIPGPYDIPSYAATCSYVLTNKTPIGTYRSPGGFEATFVCDRMIDLLADRLDRDPIEVRRQNLIRSEQMPYTRVLSGVEDPVVLEDADFVATLDRVVEEAGRDDVSRRQAAGERIGIGVGAYVERTGLGPWESASVSVPGGSAVVVRSGATPLGQGLHTALAQIVGDQLGISPSEISVEPLDTSALATGVGTYASRSTVMAGNAARLAALAVIEQARHLAGAALGIEPGELIFRAGQFEAMNSSATVSLDEVAVRASSESVAGLSASETFRVERASFSHGVVAAVVRVDAELGAVRVERLVLAYDVGRAVNPRLLAGQMHGAAVQALGGALLEQFLYDETGRPRGASLMDYLLPSLGDAPEMTVLLEESRSTTNPLGVKGAGEGGVCSVAAAIVGAIENALGVPGVIREVPATPELVWRAAASGTHRP
jgi:carbon-monoxide dehydrogenase large subunit/6-hydroxypseudooxynicotine dehydrogenase subunit gamma